VVTAWTIWEWTWISLKGTACPYVSGITAGHSQKYCGLRNAKRSIQQQKLSWWRSPNSSQSFRAVGWFPAEIRGGENRWTIRQSIRKLIILLSRCRRLSEISQRNNAKYPNTWMKLIWKKISLTIKSAFLLWTIFIRIKKSPGETPEVFKDMPHLQRELRK